MKTPILLILFFYLLGGTTVFAAPSTATTPSYNPSIQVSERDFITRSLGREKIQGQSSLVMEATSRTQQTARALGFKRVRIWVDPKSQVIRQAKFWDHLNRPITTVRFLDITHAGTNVSTQRVEVTNHKSGQTTVFQSDFDHNNQSALGNKQLPFRF